MTNSLAFSEQVLDISKCILQGDLYCHSRSDLLLPPYLHSCLLFPGSRGTGRHGGGPAWAGWGREWAKGSWPLPFLHGLSPVHASPLCFPGPHTSYICLPEARLPQELGFINDDFVLQIFGHMSNLQIVLRIPRGRRLGLFHLQIFEKVLQNVYIGFFVK